MCFISWFSLERCTLPKLDSGKHFCSVSVGREVCHLQPTVSICDHCGMNLGKGHAHSLLRVISQAECERRDGDIVRLMFELSVIYFISATIFRHCRNEGCLWVCINRAGFIQTGFSSCCRRGRLWLRPCASVLFKPFEVGWTITGCFACAAHCLMLLVWVHLLNAFSKGLGMLLHRQQWKWMCKCLERILCLNAPSGKLLAWISCLTKPLLGGRAADSQCTLLYSNTCEKASFLKVATLEHCQTHSSSPTSCTALLWLQIIYSVHI